jgi:hypothetical protein
MDTMFPIDDGKRVVCLAGAGIASLSQAIPSLGFTDRGEIITLIYSSCSILLDTSTNSCFSMYAISTKNHIPFLDQRSSIQQPPLESHLEVG